MKSIQYVLQVLFVCLIMTPVQGEEFTSLSSETNAEQLPSLQCSDLIKVIKDSDCFSPVAPFLEGAFVKLGLDVQGLSMNIETEEQVVKATMTTTGSLSPYYSIGFKNKFFGNSGFGYGLGITYLDSYALEQSITRNNVVVEADLGTYVTTSMYAVQPSLFFSIGARNRTPNTYFMTGVGLSFGYTSVRGISYLTEDILTVSAACWQAGVDLTQEIAGATEDIKSNCDQESYKNAGWGTGGRIFIGGRYKNIIADFNAANMIIASKNDYLNPLQVSLTLSYVINI